jgi:hydroxymethylglutaryl-CoA lyase
MAAELADLGVAEIGLADTIGVGDPAAVERLIAAVREVAQQALIRCHFHNSRNTGLANAYAAWRAGAASLDASIGGIGGCPFAPGATGNIPTEDTIYMLERMGIDTGYDLPRLIETTGWLSERLGKPLPGMLAKAGLFPRPAAVSS